MNNTLCAYCDHEHRLPHQIKRCRDYRIVAPYPGDFFSEENVTFRIQRSLKRAARDKWFSSRWIF